MEEYSSPAEQNKSDTPVPPKTGLFKIIFAVIIIIILLGILNYFNILPRQQKQPKNNVPTPAALCSPFATDKGEISCKEAEKIALGKYPGTILAMDKATLPYVTGVPPTTRIEQGKVWLVRIQPDNPSLIKTPPIKPGSKEMEKIETVGVAIDRSTKEILFLLPTFKK